MRRPRPICVSIGLMACFWLVGCAAMPAPRAPGPSAGATRVWEKDDSIMVYVPAGEFLMGESAKHLYTTLDEKPQHTVYLDAFWIDQTEVTNAQYRKCVEDGACEAPTTCDLGKPTYSDLSKADHPVACVTWDHAAAYCEWAGKQLPTEAEWEKAARGTDGRVYPWGNEWDPAKANSEEARIRETTAVGSYPEGASPYGALDMTGNVSEWVVDWYAEDYYRRSPDRNPTGADSGDYKVRRGGAFADMLHRVRCSMRATGPPIFRTDRIGFRCCVHAASP